MMHSQHKRRRAEGSKLDFKHFPKAATSSLVTSFAEQSAKAEKRLDKQAGQSLLSNTRNDPRDHKRGTWRLGVNELYKACNSPMLTHGTMTTALFQKQARILRGVHGLAGVGHIVSAIVILSLAVNSSWSPVLETSYEVWEETPCRRNLTLGGPERCFEQQRETETYDLNVSVVCFLFAFWSGLIHLLTVSVFWNNVYKTDMSKGISRLRWSDYVISASLMIVFIAIFSGVVDVYSLLLLATLQALVVVFGYISEKSITTRDQWMWFLVAFGAYIIQWTPIVTTFFKGIDSIPEDESSVKRILYAGLFAFAGIYTSFAAVSAVNIWTKYKYYYAVEIAYVILSLVSKTLLHWVLFYSLLSRGERLYNENNPEGTDTTYSENSVYFAIGTSVGGGIIIAIGTLILWKCYKTQGGIPWVTLMRNLESKTPTDEVEMNPLLPGTSSTVQFKVHIR